MPVTLGTPEAEIGVFMFKVSLGKSEGDTISKIILIWCWEVESGTEESRCEYPKQK
jgi:hypothetical protein